MDPITRASKSFLAEAEAFWRGRPGDVLPMIADPSERRDVVNALRLQEHAPENRRPLFLYEEPFASPQAYFDGLADAVQQDYDHIRRGAQEEGVRLPPLLASSEAGRDARCALTRAVLAGERAAAAVAERLDGVLLALVPSRIVDEDGWRESVGILSRTRRSTLVRVAVFAPPGGAVGRMLGDDGAHLRIDDEQLMEHLRQLGAPSGATAEGAPAATTAHLKELLFDAGRESAAGRHAAAAGLYRRARALCEAGGSRTQEAMVLIALGGACLGAAAPELAIESYARAAELAGAEGAWSVVCQAWLGEGGVHLISKEYAQAAAADRAAADAANRADGDPRGPPAPQAAEISPTAPGSAGCAWPDPPDRARTPPP